MITNNQIEKTLDFLRDSALDAAQAIANYEYVENYLSVLKAELMAEHTDLAVNAQEREAKRDQRYKDYLEVVKTARIEAEKSKFLIDAARTKISAWQTMEKARQGGL